MLGLVAIGAAAVGTGLSLWGNHERNEAQKKQSKETNKLAKKNLAFERDAARNNFNAGLEQIEVYQNQGEAALSTQSARSASSGLGSGGSLALVSQFSKNNLTSDLEMMNRNNQQTYDMAMRQSNLNYQGAKVSGPNQTAYAINQASTLLTGVSNIIGSGYSTSVFK